MTTPLEIARAAWGADLPDWVEALAIECGQASQNRIAQRLGRSPSMISQVLRRRYTADLGAIEERFLSVFRNVTLDCPALGLLPVHECQDWRQKARSFTLGNPVRLRMFRACASCPRNKAEDPE